MKEYLNEGTFHMLIATVSFLGIILLVYFSYSYFFPVIIRKMFHSRDKRESFLVHLFKLPALWLIYWILLKIFSGYFLAELPIYPYLRHLNTILIIFYVAWILIQAIKAGEYFLMKKYKLPLHNPFELMTWW